MTGFDTPILLTRPLAPRVTDYMKRVMGPITSQWYTNMGSTHVELETALLAHLKVEDFYLFNNGTTALLAAIKMLGLKGKVITTPFTFAATAHALTFLGITPVFCDVEEDTLTINPEKIEDLIDSDVSGILGVHVYGNPCDTSAIHAIASEYGLKVLYDAAHAFGVTHKGQGIGTYGDASIFSFHATKVFHTAEGGGLATTSMYADDVKKIRNFGITAEDIVSGIGINGKMSELHAAMGLEILPMVEEEQQRRRKVIDAYKDCLEGLPGISFVNSASAQYCVIRVSEEYGRTRNELYGILHKHNVMARRYFYPLCSDYFCYQDLKIRPYPVAQKAANEVLCLPLWGSFPLVYVEKICKIIERSSRLA